MARKARAISGHQTQSSASVSPIHDVNKISYHNQIEINDNANTAMTDQQSPCLRQWLVLSAGVLGAGADAGEY